MMAHMINLIQSLGSLQKQTIQLHVDLYNDAFTVFHICRILHTQNTQDIHQIVV